MGDSQLSDNQNTAHDANLDELYEEAGHWELNLGEKTIHAKRMPGKWRKIKWLAASVWIIYFIGPYFQWDGRQAILFDIPNRQFHLFSATILPQDFWMLSLLLLFFAILLAVATALAGRVYCGFFCFQTVWTDVFTWIEEKLEGPPQKRRKLEEAPWTAKKIGVKAVKHLIWLLIGLLTGISWVAWFYEANTLWSELLTFDLEVIGPVITLTIALFTVGTYVLAGIMREQVCFWLCPYARIQGVMVDNTTLVPTYNFHRGEPRGRLKKGEVDESLGDCIDCNLCVAVCPTGVDIRHGQQEGCIMCGLCIDACDSIMEKVGRPKDLVCYESLDVLNGKEERSLLKRPRVWIYGVILTAALTGIGFGLSSLDAIELKVLHARQPLFVMQSDGSVQNRYTLKVLNKLTERITVNISATGPEGLVLVGAEEPVDAREANITARTVFVRVPRENLASDAEPIVFHIEGTSSEGLNLKAKRDSVFIGPRK
jgi:cytochrome c oxidase accessory protein FixG